MARLGAIFTKIQFQCNDGYDTRASMISLKIVALLKEKDDNQLDGCISMRNQAEESPIIGELSIKNAVDLPEFTGFDRYLYFWRVPEWRSRIDSYFD